MSKTLFSFMVSEMTALRIICPKCSTVTEIAVENLEEPLVLQCPCCKLVYEDSHGKAGPIKQLAAAIRALTPGHAIKVECALLVKE